MLVTIVARSPPFSPHVADLTAQEVVDDHLSSLTANHLTDMHSEPVLFASHIHNSLTGYYVFGAAQQTHDLTCFFQENLDRAHVLCGHIREGSHVHGDGIPLSR
jgi:hypothetical protein